LSSIWNLARLWYIRNKEQHDKNKLYSLHAPDAECIAKGKTRQPYEFGVKVSIATTHKEGLVVGMRSMPGNHYGGHTLYETLEQVAILTEHQLREVFVDLGYHGAEVQAGTKVYITNSNATLPGARSATSGAAAPSSRRSGT
jgi:IS5 family transposase